MTVINAPCEIGMQLLDECSVDAIVTDPPYELGFMGRAWDKSGIANNVEMWRHALRVLKPGGHLLAFSGTRTYHRMVCAIEDAGFEIRDQIGWAYSTGFPKSHNLDNHRGSLICGCAVPYAHDRTEPTPERDLRPVPHPDVQETFETGRECGQILQPGLPQHCTPVAERGQPAAPEVRAGQPCVEGWGDAPEEVRQLRPGPLRARADVGGVDGPEGRICDGAPAGDGRVVRLHADSDGSRSPRGPRPDEQRAREPGTVAGQPKPQAPGAWSICRGCGMPVLPKGLGTALKPAWEPIVVARKPLVGTVAENVLAHGTGAINIDGCRVDAPGGRPKIESKSEPSLHAFGNGLNGSKCIGVTTEGRWPANLIHDGSDEVLALFPQTKGQQGAVIGSEPSSKTANAYGEFAGRTPSEPRCDSGSAARFFYCAKASKADRGEGNHHPTVKPTDLMRYLCRLVTPPGGLVLDPFTGSGSTGKAALLEGFRFIGFELSAEYAEIARRRMRP